MADKNKGTKASAKSESFEDSMARLESIVESMQEGSMPLEQLISKYEEGLKLVKNCSGKLEEAKKRIQKIEADADGKPVTGHLDPAQESKNPDENSDNSEEEVSLF